MSRGTVMLRAAKATITPPLFTNTSGTITYYFPDELECKIQYLDLSSVTLPLKDLEKMLVMNQCWGLRNIS